jgi:hypothetical protein
MDLAELCWIATAAYGLHILEELILDWRNWARSVMHLPVDWNIFYAANALVILMGIVAAELAPTQPTLALAFPALMLINAACFHLGGFLLKRGRFSPGLFTAVLLFFPIGIQCFRIALRSHTVSTLNIVESFLLGAAIMMTPILLIKLSGKPYFDQDR